MMCVFFFQNGGNVLDIVSKLNLLCARCFLNEYYGFQNTFYQWQLSANASRLTIRICQILPIED